MFINLTNIDFCPGSGGGSANLQEGKSVTYTANGSYTINPDEGYDGLSSVGVTVNYDGTDYRDQTGTADFDGLRAIGWDETSIKYLNANALHYPWANDLYKVTDGNKALYGVVNKDNVSDYKTNPNFIYCPYFDMTGVTSMYNMLSSCRYLLSIPLLDTSNVTSMLNMFINCYSLQSIPLLDTSKVTNMDSMFYYCNSLKSIPLLDTSNVTNMSSMFMDCSLLQSIPLLNTSQVTNMSSMFSNDNSLLYIPQLDTSNVTNMNSMFSYCKKIRTIPPLDTSKVTDMGGMFTGCFDLQYIPQLDMSSVNHATSSMFWYCSSLSYIRLKGSLNTSLSLTESSELDYDSVKSILTAASNTINTDSKTLSFYSSGLNITDQNGELAALVSTCTSKGWTINGLTLN